MLGVYALPKTNKQKTPTKKTNNNNNNKEELHAHPPGTTVEFTRQIQ